MARMGIVCRHQEGLCQHGQQLFLAAAQPQHDAPQGIPQEGRCCTLLGFAAHFLVVKDAANRQALALFGCQKALHQAPGTLQIVQLGRQHHLAIATHQRALLTAIQEQIMSQNGILFHTGSLCHGIHKCTCGLLIAKQRIGVHIGLILHAVIGAAVHVDGHTGDHQQIFIHCHRFYSDGSILLHQHPSGHRQRTVKPGGHQAAAVLLSVQLNVMTHGRMLGILLDLESGAVAVGRRHQKATLETLRHPEGNDGRTVAGNKILTAGLNLPLILFVERLIAGLLQHPGEVCRHMVAAGAVINKGHQFLCQILCLFHSKSSIPYVAPLWKGSCLPQQTEGLSLRFPY